MEMQMEAMEESSLSLLTARLSAAAEQLEQAADRLAGRELDLAASFDRAATREAELERLLAEAQTTIAALKSGRKTLPAGVTTLLAKDAAGNVEAGALDSALASLSPEQRIAVKSQLIRSGLLG